MPCKGQDQQYCFFTTAPPNSNEKHYLQLFADHAALPAIACFDACYSAYDEKLVRYLIQEGCNIFIGNLLEAPQDGQCSGTPAVRELLTQLLRRDENGARYGVYDCVSLAYKAVEENHPYNTVIYVREEL